MNTALPWLWYLYLPLEAKHKRFDKRDEVSFIIVKYPFLDGEVSLSPSYGVYTSQIVV